MSPRLSLSEVSALPHAVRKPPDHRLTRNVGIVHLGLGAFHRAHQTAYVEDAVAMSGESGWGVCAVAQRSRSLLDDLRAQDGLYSVLQRDGNETRVRVVGQISRVLHAADDAVEVRARLADPGCSLVTITVTEKGYRRDAAGNLDLGDELVRHDLDHDSAMTTVGQLVRGLQARMQGVGAPLTVLSCDNLVDNGGVMRRLVEQFCDALPSREGEPLRSWVAENVSFPASMVDRIVPVTSPQDRALAQYLLGFEDSAVVTTEPFTQWVVEDAFASARPKWETAGVQMVSDVRPYELLKLRVLNAAHSMLAYLGQLRGYDTIAEALADDELAESVRHLIQDDVAPTLQVPDGVDLAAYAETVVARFANPHLRHTTGRVAIDGSQKLPERLLGTVVDRLAVGADAQWAALAVAGWMECISRAVEAGRGLEDPLEESLREALRGRHSVTDVVDALLRVEAVFPEALASSHGFRSQLVEHVGALRATRSR